MIPNYSETPIFEMGIKQVVFFCKAPLESGMANTVQSLQMARAMSAQSKVLVLAASKTPESAEKKIKLILGNEISFSWDVSSNPFPVRIIQLAIWLYKQKGKSQLVITRSALIAILVLLLRQRVVLELHSDTLSSNAALTKLMAAILRSNWGRDIFKVVISKALGDLLLNKYGFSSNLVLHDGWTASGGLQRQSSLKKAKNKRHLVVYTGKISPDRGIAQILLLAKRDPYSKFLIIGGSLNECRHLRIEAASQNLSNVRVYSYQRNSRVSFLQNKADMLLAFWSHRVPTMDYCSPLKLFEYMSTGNKILLHDFNVFKEVIFSSPLINLCEPEDADSEWDRYFELKERVISNEDIAKVADYSASFSYSNRAKILWTESNKDLCSL